jgi:hypothetical protein
MNKYEKYYNQIIARAKTRTNISGYYEKHHIVPKSLGGDDSDHNLVTLTAREHFICHWLLTKIHKEGESHWKMLNALRFMRAETDAHERYQTKITARVYETLKEEYSKLQSVKNRGENNPMFGKTHSLEARRKISEANSGDKNGAKKPEARKKISEKQTGKKRKPFSDEWKQNLSESKVGEKNHRFGVEPSAETRAKIGDKIRGRKQTPEEKIRRGEANKGKKREKKLCPHCNQHIAVNGYARFHGDNCKHKT